MDQHKKNPGGKEKAVSKLCVKIEISERWSSV